jgi:hypothetical protein
MSKQTKHDELVFQALSFLRNLGADERDVRRYVRGQARSGVKDDRASLGRLEQAGDVRQVGERWFLTPQGARRARGHAVPAGWLAEDAWILLALLLCAGTEGADLSRIIGAADYIDHGIPTLEQLHGPLNRLASGRLITRRRGRFFITERARELADKAEACCRKDVQSRRKGLMCLLECPCCGVRLKKVRWSIPLDQATVDEAYRRYIKRFRSA